MKIIDKFIDRRYLLKNIHLISSYSGTLFFFEIINIMLIILFLYGRSVAVILGLTLSLIFTYHIIGISLKRDLNRKIHLFLIDFHIIWVVLFIMNVFISGFSSNLYDKLFYVIRIVLFIFDIILLYFLTDEVIKKEFLENG
jgi:hypothetical protein